jgi:hypothetical protein
MASCGSLCSLFALFSPSVLLALELVDLPGACECRTAKVYLEVLEFLAICGLVTFCAHYIGCGFMRSADKLTRRPQNLDK